MQPHPPACGDAMSARDRAPSISSAHSMPHGQEVKCGHDFLVRWRGFTNESKASHPGLAGEVEADRLLQAVQVKGDGLGVEAAALGGICSILTHLQLGHAQVACL